MTKGKNFKKILSIFTLSVIMSIPIVAFASSYTSTLYFDSTLTGDTRYYNGNNITLSISAYTGYGQATGGNFSASLYRKNMITSDYIGKAYYTRNGYSTNTWSNVGSGNYYFYFSKAIDGVEVYSNSVSMYN